MHGCCIPLFLAGPDGRRKGPREEADRKSSASSNGNQELFRAVSPRRRAGAVTHKERWFERSPVSQLSRTENRIQGERPIQQGHGVTEHSFREAARLDSY